MSLTFYESQRFEHLKLENETIANFEFSDCCFVDCTFTQCKLVQCTFSHCQFEGCQMANITATQSQMKFSEFVRCQMNGINWSELSPSGKFANAIDKLSECRLKYNHFTDMKFPSFDFSTNHIMQSMFAGCELAESSFRGCTLRETEFFQCDLRKSDFREATGYRIDIFSNKLKGGYFSAPEVLSLLDGLEIHTD